MERRGSGKEEKRPIDHVYIPLDGDSHGEITGDIDMKKNAEGQTQKRERSPITKN